MAEYVGMTTENVIRTLSEFRKDGILKIYGKTIHIVNMESLKSIADFG
jgi:CRP/FNR family transcriptional regulator